MEKQFIQAQLALFFKSDYLDPFENISLRLKELFGSELTPQVIGIPNDAPAEIPRVMLNSPKLNVNFSKNRVDFFSGDKNFILDNLDKIFLLIDHANISIGRFGFVETYFSEVSIDQFKKIFDVKKISITNPKEITVRFNEQIQIGNLKINNSQSYNTSFVKDGSGVQRDGVIIIRDINSLREEMNSNTFSKENIKTIHESIATLVDQITL